MQQTPLGDSILRAALSWMKPNDPLNPIPLKGGFKNFSHM